MHVIDSDLDVIPIALPVDILVQQALVVDVTFGATPTVPLADILVLLAAVAIVVDSALDMITIVPFVDMPALMVGVTVSDSVLLDTIAIAPLVDTALVVLVSVTDSGPVTSIAAHFHNLVLVVLCVVLWVPFVVLVTVFH